MIKNREAVTLQMANRLENALCIETSMWLSMQAVYEKDLQAIAVRDVEEQKALVAEKMLSGVVNVGLLFKRMRIDGYTFAKDRLSCLFGLLGVNDVESVMALATPSGCFKKSEVLQTEDLNLSTWILLAYASCRQNEVVGVYHKGNAVLAAKDIADEANRCTVTESFIKEKLGEYGIGYCHVAKVPKAPIDAYRFAEDMLIPRDVWAKILRAKSCSISPNAVFRSIIQEAERYGISPSIASWRYKHQSNVYNMKGCQSPRIR